MGTSQEWVITPSTSSSDGAAQFHFDTHPDYYYYLLKGTSLDNLGTLIDSTLGNGQSKTLTDLAPASLDSVRFYKVVARTLNDPWDTDKDGISDAFEIQHPFLDPLSALDANLDYDSDGLTNRKEYQDGTPLDESHLTKIEWVFPHQSARFIDLSPTIQIRFSRPLSEEISQVHRGIDLQTSSFLSSYKVTLSPDRTTLIIQPESLLNPGTQVTLQLSGQAFPDENGILLDADSDGIPGGTFIYRFKTGQTISSQTTGISGRVLEATEQIDSLGATYSQPINTFRIRNLSPDFPATYLNEFGRFYYSNTPIGKGFYQLEQAPRTRNPPGGFFPPTRVTWRSIGGNPWNPASNDGSIYLPFVPTSYLTSISGWTETVVDINPFYQKDYPDFIGTQLLVPKPPTRKSSFLLGWVPLRGNRLPIPVPDGLFFDKLIWVLHSDQFLPIPAKFRLPNTLPNTAPGSTARIWHYNTQTARWAMNGAGIVSDDGQWIVSDANTFIREPGIYGAAQVEGVEFFPDPYYPITTLPSSAFDLLSQVQSDFNLFESKIPNKPLSKYPLQTLYGAGTSLLSHQREFEKLEREYRLAANQTQNRMAWFESISRSTRRRGNLEFLSKSLSTLSGETWILDVATTLDEVFPNRTQWLSLKDRLRVELHHPAMDSLETTELLRRLEAVVTLLNEMEQIATTLAGSDSWEPVVRSKVIWEELLEQIEHWRADPETVPWPDTDLQGYQVILDQLHLLSNRFQIDRSVYRFIQKMRELEEALYAQIPEITRIINPYTQPIDRLNTRFYAFSHTSNPAPVIGYHSGESITFYLPWSKRTQVGWVDPMNNTISQQVLSLDSNGNFRSPPTLQTESFDPDRDDNLNGIPDAVERLLRIRGLTSPDLDSDGTPNHVEFKFGTLFDTSFNHSIGTLDTHETLGDSLDMTIAQDFLILADGSHGIEIFDIANHLKPLRMATIPLPSPALEVGIAGNCFVARCENEKVYWLPFRDLMQNQVLMEYEAHEPLHAMVCHGRTVYLTTTHLNAIALTLPSGTETWRTRYANQPIDFFDVTFGNWTGVSGGQIVAGRAESIPNFQIFPLSWRSPVPVNSFFMGKDWAWVSVGGTPVKLSSNGMVWNGIHPLTTFHESMGQLALNESGGGVAYVYPKQPNDPSSQEPVIQILQVPVNPLSLDVLGSIPFNSSESRPEKLALWNGLAYSLEEGKLLRRLHYTPAKPDRQSPSGTLSTSASNGLAKFGDIVHISADVLDDTLIEKVQFLIDGAIIDTDGNYPFETEWQVLPSNNTLIRAYSIGAIVWDITGRKTVLAPLQISLVSNPLPPLVVSLSGIPNLPMEASQFTPITVEFTEIIRPESISSDSIRLIYAGSDGLFNANDQLIQGFSHEITNSGKTLILRWAQPLPTGRYRLELTEMLTNLAGDPLGISYQKDFWLTTTNHWLGTQDGNWMDPGRWSLLRVPEQNDSVQINAPSTTTIQINGTKVLNLHSHANLILNSGVLHLQQPSLIQSLTQSNGTLRVDSDLVLDQYHLSDGLLEGGGKIISTSLFQWNKGTINLAGTLENRGIWTSLSGPCEVKSGTFHNLGFAHLNSWVTNNRSTATWINDHEAKLALLLPTQTSTPFTHLENNGDVILHGINLVLPSVNHWNGVFNLENLESITLGQGHIESQIDLAPQARLVLGTRNNPNSLGITPKAKLGTFPNITLQGNVVADANLILNKLIVMEGTLSGNGNISTDSMEFYSGRIQGQGDIAVQSDFVSRNNPPLGSLTEKVWTGKNLHIWSMATIQNSLQIGNESVIHLHPNSTLNLLGNSEVRQMTGDTSETAILIQGTARILLDESLPASVQTNSIVGIPTTLSGTLLVAAGRTLKQERSLEMTPSSHWIAEVNSPQKFSQCEVVGKLRLGGSLEIVLRENYSENSSHFLPLFRSARTIEGQFDHVEALESSESYTMKLHYRTQEVVLEISRRNP